MLIMLTSRCHMGCKHCMQEATARGRHMTRETFDEVLRFVSEAGPWVVNVTGGEPTEHPEWAEWTRELLRIRSVQVLSVLTNGAWIEDKEQRLRMARLVRESKGRVKVQVYSNPLYYPDHEWTVEHEQQFRSIGCTPDFRSPIFMQDISVWGGLTFSEKKADCQWDGSCVEMIGGGSFDDIPGDWWVFGFDTMHFNDGPEHDREWCVRETRQLQLQLDAIINKEPSL